MMKKFRPGYPMGKDVPRERKILFWLLLALATLLFFAAPLAMRAQEKSNTYYAGQFAGPDVATKVTNAQASCSANTSIPCVIVIDAILAVWPQGSLPGRCANCIWLDYRSVAFSATPISLSTITSVVINGATSGSVTLNVPAVAGSNTATFPAATGTVSLGKPQSQIFTATGTFTIPSGVTGVKAILCGGGGAGGGGNATNAGGGGGGAGGFAVKWLSGLTPANTIAVTVGAGGTGVLNATGNAGSASSIASGTQTIGTVTANGGSGGVGGNSGANSGGAGGTATGGDFNVTGNAGSLTWNATAAVGSPGGVGSFGGGPLQGTAAGSNSCAGGGGVFTNTVGSTGGSGVVIFEWNN